MEISIDRSDEKVEVGHITIYNGDVEYRISINKFNELQVQKQQYGEGEGAIIIKPSVSNEIRIL
jgi:hypothetical protein